jgi:hypothetical protein
LAKFAQPIKTLRGPALSKKAPAILDKLEIELAEIVGSFAKCLQGSSNTLALLKRWM